MRGKEELCKRLTKELENKITTNTFSYKKEIANVCAELNNKHGIPVDQARDIFCLTKELIYESEFIIYCFCEKITPNLVAQHFDKKEIDVYQNMKIEDNSISFPIHIPAIQVAGDQWIGSITAKKLLEFNHADLINYNKNAQRTMKHVIKAMWNTTKENDVILRRRIMNRLARLTRKDQQPYRRGLLLESGRIDIIKRFMAEDGINDIRTAYNNHKKEIEYRYGVIYDLGAWITQYSPYLEEA